MNEIEQVFAKAYKLHHEGQLAAAISLYEQVVQEMPQFQDGLHFLGLAYAQQGDMPQAINYLNQAYQINPDSAILNNLGNVYKKLNQPEQAIDYYNKALTLNPNYAQAHNNLATLFAAKNNYQQALVHYSKAVNAEPDFSAAHFNLGLLFLQHGELAHAKTQFANVISLNSKHADAHFYLGVLHLENNALIEAEKAFQQVLELDSERTQALTNLGVVALKKEQNQLAVDYFTRALALDNDDIDARNNLAATFIHHDRFENALMHYDVLLQQEPDNIEYLYNSGVAQMALGHLNEATIHFEHILRLNPNHAFSLNNLAAIYLKMDMRETAKDYLQRALIQNPKDTISQHMLHALQGSSGVQTTPEYAENLFNNYALYYEQHLQGALNYAIPKHIIQTLHQLNINNIEKCLDIGCGTGLSGIVLREISKTLTGVDISEKMLAQAKQKAIYDYLEQIEIGDFLDKNHTKYELIVAADVLPYVGELSALFKQITSHLAEKGHFIFTTEISQTEQWQLESSARFSHNPAYIHKLADDNHLKIIKQEKIPARLQNQVPLEVMLYVVERNTKQK